MYIMSANIYDYMHTNSTKKKITIETTTTTKMYGYNNNNDNKYEFCSNIHLGTIIALLLLLPLYMLTVNK